MCADRVDKCMIEFDNLLYLGNTLVKCPDKNYFYVDKTRQDKVYKVVTRAKVNHKCIGLGYIFTDLVCQNNDKFFHP